jgi:predicted metal-dependent hydrolase
VAAIPEPALNAEEREGFEKGVREFNAGHYFECHDTLEELWSGIRGPSRDFFQGLIQVAVGHYHLSGGNAAGAASMFARALKRFERYPERYFGFDLEGQRRDLRLRAERLAAGTEQPGPAPPPPHWRFD